LVRKTDLPDFTDDVARDQWFDNILNAPEMQAQVDGDEAVAERRQLKPACSRQVSGSSEVATAQPARRLVELAKGFGPNGIVQSICQDDFSTAMDVIIDRLATRLETRTAVVTPAYETDGESVDQAGCVQSDTRTTVGSDVPVMDSPEVTFLAFAGPGSASDRGQ
jgi:hypothetical protein